MTLGVDEPDARGRTGLHLTGTRARRQSGCAGARGDRAVVELVRPAHDRTRLPHRRRHLDDPAPRDLRPRKRRDRAALRPATAHRRADAAVPVHRLRQRAPRRHAARGAGRAARRGRPRDGDPAGGRGGDRRRDRRGAAPPRRLHEPRIGHREAALLRRALRRATVVHAAGLAHEGEHIEVVETAIDDALAAIGTEIVDAKTILLLQWAALSGPFRD